MIRYAKKTDALAIARLVLVILKDMELPFITQIGEEQTVALLAEAITYPKYRYGYARGIVNEVDGEVAGVAFGYPFSEEASIDAPLAAVLKKHSINQQIKLFIDPETFSNEWYLDTICVDKKYQGQGIGTQLLDALPELAKRDGYRVIGLNVDQGNPHARRLYERKGFKKVGEITISGHRYDHLQQALDFNLT